MKIGLVLFGHLRSYRQTLSSFNTLKETLQKVGTVDIFCHTWNMEESVTASWWKEHKPDDPPPASISTQQIERAYKPAKFIIEPSRQFDENGYNIQSSLPVAGILSMLHSQWKAFELLKEHEQNTGFRYDIVVKTRYDLVYEIAPGFEDLVKKCAVSEIVYLPSSNPYELIGSHSDIFAIGNRKEIEKYFSFCINFKEAVLFYYNRGYRQFLPEFCMTVYLEKIGVKKDELKYLRLHVLRMNGEKFQINSDMNFSDNNLQCFHLQTIRSNLEILPGSLSIPEVNTARVIKKYMSWLNSGANTKVLDDYIAFYKGQWISMDRITGLAKSAKRSGLFTKYVMRDFFEEAMRNGNYRTGRKLMLAIVLALYSEYNFFFIRVWKRVTFNR